MSSIKGLDSFFDVLALVKDPAKFDAKIKELKDQTDKYAEAVSAVVELSKVNDYTNSIRKREEDSKNALEEAEASAADKIIKASNEANAILSEAKEVSSKAKAAAKAVKDREDAVKAQEDALEARRASIAALEVDVSKRAEAAKALEADLSTRKAKLMAAMG